MVGSEEHVVGAVAHFQVAQVWMDHLGVLGAGDDEDAATEIAAEGVIDDSGRGAQGAAGFEIFDGVFLVGLHADHAALGGDQAGGVADDVLLDVHLGAIGEGTSHLGAGVLLARPLHDAVGGGVDVDEALAVDGGEYFEAAAAAIIDHAHDDAGLVAVGVGVDGAGVVGFFLEEAADRAIGFGVERDKVFFVFDAGERLARAQLDGSSGFDHDVEGPYRAGDFGGAADARAFLEDRLREHAGVIADKDVLGIKAGQLVGFDGALGGAIDDHRRVHARHFRQLVDDAAAHEACADHAGANDFTFGLHALKLAEERGHSEKLLVVSCGNQNHLVIYESHALSISCWYWRRNSFRWPFIAWR